jgi:BolA protein
MKDPLFELIETRLASLQPHNLQIIDSSAAHAGHAGNIHGNAHLELHLGSPQFAGLTTIACHRLIYQLLNDLIPHPIHALNIKIIR